MKPIETPHAYQARTPRTLLGEDSMGDRLLRMQYDFWEPAMRFKEAGVHNSIVFFGSASLLPQVEARQQLESVRRSVAAGEFTGDEAKFQLSRAENMLEMARFYELADQLAFRLTRWNATIPDPENRFYVCSGGGNGIMEAANRGAYRAGGRSIALSINIPTEQSSNPYVTPELSFNFNYFLLRKFWFLYFARGIVAFPGGAGTLDELFEVFTLILTGRQRKFIPVILFGSEYWKSLINFDLMVKNGLLDRRIYDAMVFCDSIDEAFDILIKYVTSSDCDCQS